MRLLQTSTFELVTKYQSLDDTFPPYAILSHTWGTDNEEISLQDLQYVLATRKNRTNDLVTQSLMARPGFIKIQRAAKLALSEGYDFIWIDTCCIDKTSSAELSEAINSMFQWYEQSTVCYVFLSDVEAVEDAGDQLPPETCDAISSSRWFTRGWTLQELIAPSNLRFYSKDWAFLATKDGHFGKTYLSAITGIDMSALVGSQELEYFSVATRMKWASQRKTTRLEDMAYCLMGIFNVNMPLLYGEGTKAFIRLQEEILRGDNDQSLFAWRCPKDDPHSSQLSGLLAKTPVWFQDSEQFRPLPINVEASASAPSSMTNAGLYVQFRLHSQKESTSKPKKGETGTKEDVVAVLHCSPYICEDGQENKLRKAALRLAHLGGDRYSRLSCDSIVDIDPSELESGHSTYEYIYVKQTPTVALPDIYVDDRMMNHELSAVWFQKGQWNESTKTLRCNKPGRGGILGVFRYSLQRPRTRGSLVDVMVGFHSTSLRLGASSYWCFQQTVSDDKGLDACFPPSNVNLSSEHYHNSIAASVTLERKDQIYNELTLELKQEETILLPTAGNHFSAVPIVPIMLQSREKPHYISLWLSTLTQPDLLTLSGFETDFIRVGSIPDYGGSGQAAVDKLRTGLKALKLEVKIYPPGKGAMTRLPSGTVLVPQKNAAMLRPLIRACRDGDSGTLKWKIGQYATDLVEHLLDIPTKLDKFEMTNDFRLIHWAVAGGNREIVREILRFDGKVRTRLQRLTALHLAAIMGNVPIIKELIEGSEEEWAAVLRPMSSHCKPFDNPCDSPMHLAAAYIHSPEVEEAFECMRRVQPDKFGVGSNAFSFARNGLGETPLHRAAAMNNTHAVSALLAHAPGAQSIECLDNKTRSPLWHAAATDAYDTLLLLLKGGADANTRDELGISALHAACRSARSEVVQALLSYGADPNDYPVFELGIKTSSKLRSTCMTCCMYAALRGNAATLCALLAAGSRVDGPDGPDGSDLAPIHIAAANGHLDFIKILCGKGGLKQQLGAKTPYWVRTQSGLPGVEVKILPEGQEATAIDLARLSGKDDIVSYLESL